MSRYVLVVVSLVVLSGCGLDPSLVGNLSPSVDDTPKGKPNDRFQIRYEFGLLKSATGPDQTCVAIERATVEDLKKYQPIGPTEYWVYGDKLHTPKGRRVGDFERSSGKFRVVTSGAISGYSYEQKLSGTLGSAAGQWVSVGRNKDGSVACQVVYPVSFVVEKVYGARKLLVSQSN